MSIYIDEAKSFFVIQPTDVVLLKTLSFHFKVKSSSSNASIDTDLWESKYFICSHDEKDLTLESDAAFVEGSTGQSLIKTFTALQFVVKRNSQRSKSNNKLSITIDNSDDELLRTIEGIFKYTPYSDIEAGSFYAPLQLVYREYLSNDLTKNIFKYVNSHRVNLIEVNYNNLILEASANNIFSQKFPTLEYNKKTIPFL